MGKRTARTALRNAGVLMAILLWAGAANASRDDDVVILRNGDRMTGEIKSLQRGELRFKAGYMAEAVRLDWTKVQRLESKSQFIIYLTNGQRFTGSLQVDSPTQLGIENFVIDVDKDRHRVNQIDVLRIAPAEEMFWRQLEGSIDFGFSFTSGNDQYQAQFLASAIYRRGTHTFGASVDSVFSGQPKGTSTARKQFTFDYTKQLTTKYYAGGLLDFLSSDQQSLDLRTTAGALLGRNFVQTERTRLSAFAGAVGTREKYSATLNQTHTTNADALTGVDFLTFRFNATDIRSRVMVFPSLSNPGRMRMQATTDLSIKVAKDLWWGFHFYENFDSKPPISANKNDLGISTSLGWKF
jgi:putative salt-induced outer membrane protein YdiY